MALPRVAQQRDVTGVMEPAGRSRSRVHRALAVFRPFARDSLMAVSAPSVKFGSRPPRPAPSSIIWPRGRTCRARMLPRPWSLWGRPCPNATRLNHPAIDEGSV
jgi:hypothetical protein